MYVKDQHYVHPHSLGFIILYPWERLQLAYAYIFNHNMPVESEAHDNKSMWDACALCADVSGS